MEPLVCENKKVFTIDEALLRYEDEDVLFTCRNEQGLLFLGQVLNDFQYMLAEISLSKVAQLKSKAITMKEAFVQASEVIYVNRHDDGCTCDYRKIEDVSDADLPLAGHNLFTRNSTLPCELQDLAVTAVENQQDMMKVKLRGPYNEKIIKISLFSRLVNDLRTVTDYLSEKLASALQQLDNEHNNNFCFAPASEGSFVMNLVSPTQRNLEQSTGYSKAFDKLVDMMDCRDNSMAAYEDMPYEVVEGVKNFMYALKKNKYSFDIAYANHEKSTAYYSCNNKMIEKKYRSLCISADKITREVEFTGIFYGANMKRKRFYFQDGTNKKEMSGNIDKNVGNIECSDPRKPETHITYNAAFKELTWKYPSGESIPYYTLIDIERI